MISLLAWIIIGGIAGWIASIIVGANERMGCLSNIIVGMIGSLVGGFLVALVNTGRLDFWNTAFNDLNLASLIVSVIGAVVFLAILKFVRQ